MECERVWGWMMDALDGALSPDEEEALQDHLARCAGCRVEWGRLQAVEQLLREAPMVRPPIGFTGRVLSRLDRRQRIRRGVLGGIALAMGTVCLLLLAAAPLLGTLSAPSETLALVRTQGLLVLRLADVGSLLLRSLRLTAGALLPALLSLGLCALVTTLTACLAWFGLLRSLRPATVLVRR